MPFDSADMGNVGGLASDTGRGIAVFIDEMQDLGPDDISALCAACHELSQSGLPVIVVGAGLPHLPAVLSASKSYSERLFRYNRIDRLSREEAVRAMERYDRVALPVIDSAVQFQHIELALDELGQGQAALVAVLRHDHNAAGAMTGTRPESTSSWDTTPRTPPKWSAWLCE